jgi:hypothetical protein
LSAANDLAENGSQGIKHRITARTASCLADMGRNGFMIVFPS